MSDTNKENPLRSEKRNKLSELRAAGVNPYPYSFNRTASLEEIKTQFNEIEIGEAKEDHRFRVAGRLMTKRPMGKATFFNIQDQNARMQIYCKTAELSEKDQVAFKQMDIGDIVGVEGYVFKTKKGELSLRIDQFEMLCKTLEPLPEKYHGLTDIEQKYRLRHLDLIMNEDSRRVFETRSKIIREIRNFLDKRGFLEVETPVLQPLYGGAAAYPFSTHHRALDMKLYLKISPELYLKRLLVGGFEKVYEVSKNFRNEGIDRSHNPEFLLLEWYEAYTDYLYQMTQFEELVAHLAKTVTGSTVVKYQDRELDFTPPWPRLTVVDGIKKYVDIDVTEMSAEQIFDVLKSKGADIEKPLSKGEMIMELFEHEVEKHLWQPTFVMDHPVEISPLTKIHRDKPGFVERFEPFAAQMEIGNSYSELNDPEDQLQRLKEQEAKRVVDEEAQPMDDDFMHAIDVGMPPTGGVGLGVERIIMLLTNQTSIRDTIFFPTMKHKP